MFVLLCYPEESVFLFYIYTKSLQNLEKGGWKYMQMGNTMLYVRM